VVEVLIWMPLPAYYLLAAGVWLVFAVHGQAAAGTGFVLHGLAAALLLLLLLLLLPLFRDPQRGRLRVSRPLPYATAIIAAALLAGEILAGRSWPGKACRVASPPSSSWPR
jgi:hypothetical protein